ncbi:class I SAM-dependent DNA methyltransferase [Qipengyuania atrilutea]|uniref:Methyltransferase domain-containing protein n=1 Tax=Qipengyuania atrilutea TaxID=2744473 RepID=A0A850HDR1_9SPHN|nr:class I SAM-dependent methyltransferase [Actirhodobacter atriluteus]NVD45309.1 methyltransferase domain-containing protein [Actirhodobacter atriluteus]
MADELSRRDRFETLFEDDPDPWDFETSSYEREKRKHTIDSLGGRRFECALEIGCATGALTEELADISGKIIGIDIADRALAIARTRLADRANVTLIQGELPYDWPAGSFDLIMFSEVLYFLSQEEIREVSSRALQSLSDDGVCLLVNWTGPSNLPLGGNEVVNLFAKANDWKHHPVGKAERYRIDKLLPVRTV